MEPDGLIVGRDSQLGQALLQLASDRGLQLLGTTRRLAPEQRLGWNAGALWLDLEQPLPDLPRVPVAWLCAGVVGYKHCEGNPRAHRVNVDGTLALVRRLATQGSFIVFMSSDAAERLQGTAYGLHKALVEVALQTLTEDCAIVRAGRLDAGTLPELCRRLLDLGLNRRRGLHHFGA